MIELGLAGLVRHGLRHTALTWMADSGVPLYVLQRVAGHQDPAVTARYLHPEYGRADRGRKRVFGLVGAKWGPKSQRPGPETDQASHEETGA